MLLDYLDLFPSCLPWFLRATCLLCPTRPLPCTQHANCSSCSNSQPMSHAYTFRGLLADWSHYLAQSHRFLPSHPPCSPPSTSIFRFNRHDKGPESYSVRLIRACPLSKTLIPHVPNPHIPPSLKNACFNTYTHPSSSPSSRVRNQRLTSSAFIRSVLWYLTNFATRSLASASTPGRISSHVLPGNCTNVILPQSGRCLVSFKTTDLSENRCMR